MTSALRVVAPGLMTTVQDLGRIGYQNLGVGVCGALDPVSLRAANLLVGNPPEVGALEIAYLGPTLAVQAEEVRVAVVGATAVIEILSDPTASGGRRVEPLRSFRLRRGEGLRIGALTGGSVLYLAIEGGFDIEPVLGSVATDVRGRIGGCNGQSLVAGDKLPLRFARPGEREEVRLEGWHRSARSCIRAIVGPQGDRFPDSEVAAFFAAEYTIGAGSNRMGMRLAGRPIKHKRGFDIVSDAIAPGSIQVPGNGQPIVLLADRQTTGGYPKIATVISADVPALASLPVGAKVAFEAVTLEQAAAARREFIDELTAMKDKIVPLRVTGVDLVPRLHDCNLISGVVDAAAA
jgi:biotin-dependent carboxylase-like uncharacterized protein